MAMRKPTRPNCGEGCHRVGKRAMSAPHDSAGVLARACMHRGERGNTGSPMGWLGSVPGQPVTRERRTGLDGVAERAVVPLRPGNVGGGKGPWSETSAGWGERGGDWR